MERFPPPDVSTPALTTAQMIEVDRLMSEQLGVDLTRMMENAGRNLAELARCRFLRGDARERVVVVLAGAGGNGGGSLVAARRLHAWGAAVMVCVASETSLFRPVPAAQLAIVERLGIPVVAHTDVPDSVDLISDGLIGYTLRGQPRGTAAELIRWANTHSAKVLSLDDPSGLDATKGPSSLTIKADATMTLALPKVGLQMESAKPWVGELYLADLGVPSALFSSEHLNLEVEPVFARADILRLS